MRRASSLFILLSVVLSACGQDRNLTSESTDLISFEEAPAQAGAPASEPPPTVEMAHTGLQRAGQPPVASQAGEG